MRTLTKRFEFDAAHRIMDENVKCFNLHGHRFAVEITLGYEESGNLGYAVDFKDIKKYIGDAIDKAFDHACILNPADTEIIELCERNGWRHYIMRHGKESYMNPTAENMMDEVASIVSRCFHEFSHVFSMVNLQGIRFYETPTCWVERTF